MAQGSRKGSGGTSGLAVPSHAGTQHGRKGQAEHPEEAARMLSETGQETSEGVGVRGLRGRGIGKARALGRGLGSRGMGNRSLSRFRRSP